MPQPLHKTGGETVVVIVPVRLDVPVIRIQPQTNRSAERFIISPVLTTSLPELSGARLKKDAVKGDTEDAKLSTRKVSLQFRHGGSLFAI